MTNPAAAPVIGLFALDEVSPGLRPARWRYTLLAGAVAAGARGKPAGQGSIAGAAARPYVRRWVSELGELPAPLIHQPWQASPLELGSAGVELGASYPEPVIDQRRGRERALAAYAKLRKGRDSSASL